MFNKYNNINNNIARRSTITIALCGNPNCGKTTLFNLLTGSNQKVGNWPGVTVERKSGQYKANRAVTVVDTPGIYSLAATTPDEMVARHYLVDGNPDLIVNIVDATNLERNLLLTSQLLELDTPIVVALNMCDEATAKGIITDIYLLEHKFGCKFFEISAVKNQGVKDLMNYCIAGNYRSKKSFIYSADIENVLTDLAPLTQSHKNQRWLALKLLEGDKHTAENLCKTQQQRDFAKNTCQQLQNKVKNDISAFLTEQRYIQLGKIASVAQKMTTPSAKEARARLLTRKIDSIVLNKWLAFPIFAVVMTLIFYLSIGSIGGLLTDLINKRLTSALQTKADAWLSHANKPWLNSLIVEGIIGGVMSAVGFLPQVTLLFGCIAVLEASGYMSRIAFITDKLLCKIGLGGRSFVSMVLGCGCSVPAIMATRTIKNINERNATITLTPFMPCSAKLAVISFFTTYVLGGNALFAISFYFLSIFAVIAGGFLLKKLTRNNADQGDAFVMELPNYRAPTIKNVAKQMWDRGKAFIFKAGTVIFVASVALWALKSFNYRFELTNVENSILASIGKLIAPIFIPLGFNDGGYGWQFSVATLTGIAAKETVVTTLQILLPQGIGSAISPLGAYSFVAYNLLTVPCMAAISASFAEQGNWKYGVKSILFQIATAYIVSLTIYQLGSLAHNHATAFTITLCVCAVVVGVILSVKYLATHRNCHGECANCKQSPLCKRNND